MLPLGNTPMRRRLMFGSALVTALGVGCMDGRGHGGEPTIPGEQTSSQSANPASTQPPECADLAAFPFSRAGICDPTAAASESVGAAGDQGALDWWRLLPITSEQLAVCYQNAVIAFDLATGHSNALLAPRRADTPLYAADARRVVVPRCDGVLEVYEDGCITQEMPGHEPGARIDGGIVGLAMTSEDHLVSLGADHTIRSWRPSDGLALESAEWDGGQEASMEVDAERGLVISTAQTIDIRDSTTLERTHCLPAPQGPVLHWVPTQSGAFVAADSKHGLLLTPDDGQLQPLSEQDGVSAVATSTSGQIAYLSVGKLFTIDENHEHSAWQVFASQGELAFSADGSTIFVLDPVDGVTGWDVDTRTRTVRTRIRR